MRPFILSESTRQIEINQELLSCRAESFGINLIGFIKKTNNTSLGILFMISAIFLLSIMDGFSKISLTTL